MPCTLQLEQPPAQQAWLIPNLLPQGELVLLDGPSGVGKSCLAAALAADFSHQPHDGQGVGILFLPSKQQRASIITFLNRQEPCFDHIHEVKYHLGTGADPDQSQLVPFAFCLENIVKEHKPRLVVIDSLEEALSDGAPTDNRAWNEFWARLHTLAHECNCTILIPRKHGLHENRQYGPITRIGSEVAQFILTMHYHPIDPQERIVTVAKHQTGPIGHQTHARFIKNKLHLLQAEAHEHVRPARAPATWQPREPHREVTMEILHHVESYMMGTVTPKQQVKEYVLERGFSERAYERAMSHIKLPCKRQPGSKEWVFIPTTQMETRSIKAQAAPAFFDKPAETSGNHTRAHGTAAGGPNPAITRPAPLKSATEPRRTG